MDRTLAILLTSAGESLAHGHRGRFRRRDTRRPVGRHAGQQVFAIFDDLGHPDAEKLRAKLAGLPPPVAE